MSFPVTEKSFRPAVQQDICAYCKQPVGEPHKKDCVLIKKKVLVRMTVEYEISVPASYDKERVEFQRNEGTWCADNALDELQDLRHKRGCLCGVVKFTCLRDTGEYYLEEN